MAPLFPMGLIDQGWYLILIFLIGSFFGLVLEQSGFSSSRKLAGVFYGYDFVVLKVFFTAGVTAMAGLVILGYFGLIDLSAIFVNSNFLLSAVVGGVIMGFGFILGGFCPGTSLTGAVIGKIDAMVFIVGIFLGIFVFGAFDTTFNKLFTGVYLDGELLSDTLGLSKHLMVFLMIMMAIAAFGVAAYFEKRATKGLRPTNTKYPRLGAEVLMAITIGLVILFLPQQKSKALFEANEQEVLALTQSDHHLMSADELAYMIIHNPKKLNIIDVRSQEAYQQFNLPGSLHIPLSEVTLRENSETFADNTKKGVLVSNGGVEASKALVLLARQGYRHLYVLEGGLNGFVDVIFNQHTPPEGLVAFDEISKYRFRKKAADLFGDKEGGGLSAPKAGARKSIPAAGPKKMAGGC